MLRKLQIAVATMMVLAMAACGSITNPVPDSDDNSGASGGGRNGQDLVEAPATLVDPDEGIGGPGARNPAPRTGNTSSEGGDFTDPGENQNERG